MPAEYLNLPHDESGVDVEGEPTGDGTQPGSTEVETTVPLSSVETVFNKLTQTKGFKAYFMFKIDFFYKML